MIHQYFLPDYHPTLHDFHTRRPRLSLSNINHLHHNQNNNYRDLNQ